MAKEKEVTVSKNSEPESKKKQVKHAELVAEATPVSNPPEVDIQVEPAAAKAGKRSAKAVKQAEEKQAKEVRKAAASSGEKPTKKDVVKTRTKAERAGKK